MNEYSHTYRLSEHLGKMSVYEKWTSRRLMDEINTMKKVLKLASDPDIGVGLASGIRLALQEMKEHNEENLIE